MGSYKVLTTQGGVLNSHSDADIHSSGIHNILISQTTNAGTSLSDTNNKTKLHSTAVASLACSPMTDTWHDIFAFMPYEIINHQTTTNGTSWTTSTTDISSLFIAKEYPVMEFLSASMRGRRFTVHGTQLGYAFPCWIEFGVGYTSPFSQFEVLVESSSNGSTWTRRGDAEVTSNAKPWYINIVSPEGDPYIRFTFLKTTELTTGIVNLSCLRALSYRKGDQGRGKEFEFPYNWDSTPSLLPFKSTSTLGKDSADAYRWAGLYLSGATYTKGHVYLLGAYASSSTSNTSQVVFGTGSSSAVTQHVSITSNTEAVIINPSTSSTTGQIILKCGSSPSIKVNGNAVPTMSTSGASGTIYYLMGTPSTIGAILYRYGTSGPYMKGTEVYAGSDINYKTDIKPLSQEYIDTLFLKDNIIYDFKWKDTNKESSGFIAQDIETIMPEVVNGEDGEKHVNYNAALSKVVGALFLKVKEQQKEIDELKKLINEYIKKEEI